jgi:hypothetical protein
MRAITVRQPWAHAIIFMGKTVENRSWSTSYRGPLLIHAGKAYDREAWHDALDARRSHDGFDANLPRGVILGVVRLAGVHGSDDCTGRCTSWSIRDQYHWELVNPRAFPEPIPAKGALGLWTPPADVPSLLPLEDS